MGWRLPTHLKQAAASLSANADAAAQHVAHTTGQVAAFHDAILACALLSMLGLIGVVLMRDSDAAASMGKKSDSDAGAH